jgi:membrane protein implicated in regulation of membrane protease activity
MDAWVLWILLAVILATGEVMSPSFFLAPFAIGALLGAVADAAGTGTAALVGRTAIVTELIDNDAGSGTVKLDGEFWTARAYAEEEVIAAGRRVHVVEIKGATALVSETD